MGKRIDIVLVRLCAVIIVVLALQSLANFVGFFANTPQATSVSIAEFVLAFLLPVLLAAALWMFPAKIIGRYPDVPEGYTPDLAYMAVVLIGLYMFLFGLIDLAYYESYRITEQNIIDPAGVGIYKPSPEMTAGRYTNLAQIVIGLSLLLGKRRISDLIRKTRAQRS